MEEEDEEKYRGNKGDSQVIEINQFHSLATARKNWWSLSLQL